MALFVLSECLIANQYMEECKRLRRRFGQHFDFKIVYAEKAVRLMELKAHAESYGILEWAFWDEKLALTRLVKATISPQAVVFNRSGKLEYSGRIDNLYASLGRRRPRATVHDLSDALTDILSNKPVRNPRTTPVGCVIPLN